MVLVSITIVVKVYITAFCLRVCSRLMISIIFYIMNEFAKAVEDFIKSSEDDQFVFCHI
jgi:hypothetical protein